MMTVNDFHFGKNTGNDYASFEKVVLVITELSPKNHKYLFDSISLSHPFLKYERYDHLDNFQNMFGKKGVNITSVNSNPAKFNLVIEIGRYIKVLAKNFFRSNYKINRLAIYEGDLKFNDFSVSEKFSVNLNPIYVIGDSINKNNKLVNASFKTGIKPYGNASVYLSINPKREEDFDMQYHIRQLPAALFNPYTISFTSFPLDRGTLELEGNWNVRNSVIQSNNHLLIIDPRVTKRIRNKDLKWLPVPLIMSFVRERGNVIDYRIPIIGDLKNPKFHLYDVLRDVFENIFIKPATTPYRMEVKHAEREIEKSLTLKWPMRDALLRPNQETFIQKMADFLLENPNAHIEMYPQDYSAKEKEYILFFEAKKKYFLALKNNNSQSLNEDETEKVNKMSVKDSLFVHYLNKHTTALLFTVQDKCSALIGPTLVNKRFKQLNKQRATAFIFLFKKNGTEKQINIHRNKSVVPYNGFSFYKMEYKGELPESLIKAYMQMEELNNEAPRKKFKEERRKNKL